MNSDNYNAIETCYNIENGGKGNYLSMIKANEEPSMVIAEII